MARARQSTPAKAAQITLPDVAKALGWSRRDVTRSRLRNWWLWGPHEHRRIGKPPTYDAQLVDLLRAIHGQPHNEVAAPGADWLTRYLKGDT